MSSFSEEDELELQFALSDSESGCDSEDSWAIPCTPPSPQPRFPTARRAPVPYWLNRRQTI